MSILTLETAKQAKENDSLYQWVVDFMDNDNNKSLAKTLKENKDIFLWTDLIEFPLNKLTRIMGPEKDMLFQEKEETWERRVGDLVNEIKNNSHIPCPLIVTDFWENLNIADGSHRHEALLRNNIDKYWIIFLIKYKKNIDWVLNNLE